MLGLDDVDDFGGVALLFFEGDGEDAVFEAGADAFLFDFNWESYGAAEFAPVAFLDVPFGGVFVFAAAQNSGDGQDVVGDADVEILSADAGGAGLDY